MPLKSTLTSLASALEKSYPRKLAELGKPATKKSLDALQKGVDFELPADVVTLYFWHGSAEGLLTDKDVDDSSEGWTLSDPAGVLADYRIWTKLEPKGWDAAWLPLFTNHAGDNVCLDARSGKLVGLFHETPGDHPVVAKSLEDAFAYILKRVKAGTWRGVPESHQAARIFAKLQKSPGSAFSVFGNDVFRLLSVDPRAVLQLVADAEPLGITPSLLRKYEALANLERKGVDATYQSYLRYLDAIRREGSTYNAPFSDLRVGFEALEKPGWAEELRQIEALDKEYVLDRWLSAVARKAQSNELFERLVAWIDERIAGAKGPALARLASVKAAALRELGDAAAAEEAWQLAVTGDAETAALCKSHPVLS